MDKSGVFAKIQFSRIGRSTDGVVANIANLFILLRVVGAKVILVCFWVGASVLPR